MTKLFWGGKVVGLRIELARAPVGAVKRLIQCAWESKHMPSSKSAKVATKPSRKPALLAGGNPKIAKAVGDAPVKAYIAAMPGWKRGIGSRLDTLISGSVRSVCKAVKWNSPFYGIEGQGWFLSFHCYTKFVKVAFFRGASLNPPPPGESTQPNVRYLDIHESDTIDEAQFSAWVKQASKLPGWGKT